LSFYTQPAYLAQLHGSGKGAAYVAPASWINGEDVLDDGRANLLWDTKASEPVRFLFAGRLESEKGVMVLLQAIDKLVTAGVRGTLHVIGEGSLRPMVVAAQRERPFSVKYFEPVPYGVPFFTFLQEYHAVVVPSLSDEQPRIVFDAAARAVPALASATDGLRPHVENNRSGRLIAPGNPEDLAEALVSWIRHPEILRDLGMEALFRVRKKTHRAMHAERSHIIVRHLCAGGV
jgi:glycosyltransferase involved in cell wall biosynthesis